MPAREIKVYRDENGDWWHESGKSQYTAEDAEVLDVVLLGMTPEQAKACRKKVK